jgi:hypothetical protein
MFFSVASAPQAVIIDGFQSESSESGRKFARNPTNWRVPAGTIIGRMARGWESKSVEEQQSESMAAPTGSRQKLTPEQVAGKRHQAELQLARKHILDQLQTIKNARHRKMLEDALADLESRIQSA